MLKMIPFNVSKAELEITCSIVNIGTVIIGRVLTDSDFDLANELLHGYLPTKKLMKEHGKESRKFL